MSTEKKNVLQIVSPQKLVEMIRELHKASKDTDELSQFDVNEIVRCVTAEDYVRNVEDVVDLLIEELDDVGIYMKPTFDRQCFINKQ